MMGVPGVWRQTFPTWTWGARFLELGIRWACRWILAVSSISLLVGVVFAAQRSCEDPKLAEERSVVAKLSSKTDSRVGQMVAQEARRRSKLAEILIMDVRPKLEFSAGHVPRAMNLPLTSLEGSLGGLEKSVEVLVYDRDPSRSRIAAEKFSAAGFKVSELLGGIVGWVMKGYPLEVGNGP